MKKRLVIIVGLVTLFVGAGVFAYANRNQAAETTQTTRATDLSEPKSEPTTAAGAYVEYSAEAVKAASGTKILFFHAPWCPQCRELDTSIKNGTVPDGVTIFKVDYDANQALRKQYGVTIQTTLVSIDANGNLVKKFVAYDDPSLSAVTSNLLP